MSSWITNSLKTLRIRVGGAGGPVSQQRQYGAQVKEVKIPQKPKKPLSPYFRFLGQVRGECQRENPSLRATELMKVVGQRWESLDDASKQPFISAYKSEAASYSSILEKYKKSLTPEQKDAQQQLKLDRQLMREKREKRKRLKELGKPKKPASPFFMYLANNVPKGSTITEYQNAAKTLSEAWKSMSEAEKAPYLKKYKENQEIHSKSLERWEEKMLKQGNDDMVREETRKTAAKSRAK